MGGPGWRPISPEEEPALAALGALVRGLRDEFGLTQEALGRIANVSASHIGSIERRQRRARRSTLERIVRAVVIDEEMAELRIEEMIEAAGEALGEEESEAQKRRLVQRLERRDRRWGRKHLEATIQIMEKTQRTLRTMVRRDEAAGRDDESALARRRLFEKGEEQLARMRLEAEQRLPEPAGPTVPGKGPAWHAKEAFLKSLVRTRRGSVLLTADQEERLRDLDAAVAAEEA